MSFNRWEGWPMYHAIPSTIIKEHPLDAHNNPDEPPGNKHRRSQKLAYSRVNQDFEDKISLGFSKWSLTHWIVPRKHILSVFTGFIYLRKTTRFWLNISLPPSLSHENMYEEHQKNGCQCQNYLISSRSSYNDWPLHSRRLLKTTIIA